MSEYKNFLLISSEEKLLNLETNTDFLLDDIFGETEIDLEQKYCPSLPNDFFYLLKTKDKKISDLKKTIEFQKNVKPVKIENSAEDAIRAR